MRLQLRRPSILGGINRWNVPRSCAAHRLGHFRIELLLQRLLHAARVRHQLQVGQDFGLVSADVAHNGFVGQQLGEVALGHDQVEQVRAVV